MNQSSMRSVDRSPTNARGTAPGWARRLAAVLMVGAVAAVPAAWSQAQNTNRANTTTTEGGNDVVRVELDKPLTELPKGFSIQSPARIALDFAGVGNSTGRTSVDLNQGNIKSANVVEAGDRTRVVLNLGQASQYQAQIAGNTLLVTLQGSASAAAPRASSQAAFAEAATRQITIQPGTPREKQFVGEHYLLHYGLPQFFFHVNATYAIARHNGVELGKRDYMGQY